MSQKTSSQSILFLGKSGDPLCQQAYEYCLNNFEKVEGYMGSWGEPLPEPVRIWQGDIVISYLSRWVVPISVLEAAKNVALNFHPATPDYPGIGCNNFALYHGVDSYGATCHHMAKTVDTGKIIKVKTFAVTPSDNVESILEKTYQAQYELFQEVAGMLLNDQPLPDSELKWTRKPFTRVEFEELFKIELSMDKDEIARRIRAVSFGQYQPYIQIGKHRFKYVPEDS